MWKSKVQKMEGITINVPYDGKKKIIKWKIEGFVTKKNTNNEAPSEFHPVYDYQTMDPMVENPLHNFLDFFSELEIHEGLSTLKPAVTPSENIVTTFLFVNFLYILFFKS